MAAAVESQTEGSQAGPGRRRRRRVDRALRLVSYACLLSGLLLIAGFAYGMFDGVQRQHQLTKSWQQRLIQSPPPAVPVEQPQPNLMQPVDGVDFALRVPRLGYYAAVREGVDLTVLYSAPGHYPETPWPGQRGMVAVAAHNVYWIDFPQLTKGDEVDLETRYGTFRYTVTGTRIVEPDDRSIVVQGPGRHLTLTTCWPTWAGSFANRRYVIFTDQTYPAPPAPTSTVS
ncbi:MAG: class D sortase [Candidatus Dormibacteraeota bacterium]|nr:class D sortase [Candidatus Dormibacteraeota bacterium]